MTDYVYGGLMGSIVNSLNVFIVEFDVIQMAVYPNGRKGVETDE